MSVGLQAIRSIIEHRANTAFRELQPDLFTPEEEPVYEFVRDFYRNHGGLPSLQTIEENGIRLTQAPDPLSYYITRLRDRATYSSIQAHHNALMGTVRANSMEEARQVVSEMYHSMQHYQNEQSVIPMPEAMQAVLEDYDRVFTQTRDAGITLRWPVLDEATGGVEPGDICTIVARTGVGKSWILLAMAQAAWLEGYSILFVSMENSVLQSARRFLGLQSGINPRYIRRGQLATWDRERLEEIVGDMRDSAPFYWFRGDFSASAGSVDSVVQELQPDIVYIDASYLLSPEGRIIGRSQWERIDQVQREIKSLALRRNRPVVQTVQLNKEGGRTRDPNTLHIGGSDSIGQNSSIVLTALPGEAPHENTRRRLKVVKNREDETGLGFQINFLFDPMDFTMVEEEQAEQTNVEWML